MSFLGGQYSAWGSDWVLFGDVSKPIFPSTAKCCASTASGQRVCVSVSKRLSCTSDRVRMGKLLEWQILARGSVHKGDCYHDGPLKPSLANAWISVSVWDVDIYVLFLLAAKIMWFKTWKNSQLVLTLRVSVHEKRGSILVKYLYLQNNFTKIISIKLLQSQFTI